MSVRGLVTVVIGVNSGALTGQLVRQYSSNSGKPKPKGMAIRSQARGTPLEGSETTGEVKSS